MSECVWHCQTQHSVVTERRRETRRAEMLRSPYCMRCATRVQNLQINRALFNPVLNASQISRYFPEHLLLADSVWRQDIWQYRSEG